MYNEVEILLNNNKLNIIYSHNLFSIKSICMELGIWDNYSDDQKFELENLTKRDSIVNRHFLYQGEYDLNLTHGEVIKSGVELIASRIRQYKDIDDNDVFVDLGSGLGKLVMNMAIISEIKTLIGVEILEQRCKYSKYIYNKIAPFNNKGVFFINKNILDFDLSMATVVFVNIANFDTDLIYNIYNRLPRGCHLITPFQIPECKIFKEKFGINASWMDDEILMNYYIK